MKTELILFLSVVLSSIAPALDSEIRVLTQEGRVFGTILLQDLPALELEQATRDGFRSELSITLRLVRRHGGRFPWIDRIHDEHIIKVTIWYDRMIRFYFLEESTGKILAVRTLDKLLESLSRHHFSFLRSIGTLDPKDFYVFYRAEIRPIRIVEPLQLFLVSPFFTVFQTPWRSAELEAINP